MSFFKYNRQNLMRDAVDAFPRFDTLEELNKTLKHPQISIDDIPDDLLQHTNKNTDFRRMLGIPIGPKGEVPSTGGMPRIFVIDKDQNGTDRIMSLEEAGTPIGSREFWQKAQLGKVFAYPVGERTPVQLSVRLGPAQMAVKTSKPLEPDKIPLQAGPAPKRPGFWQRVLHSINKNWASEDTRKYYTRSQGIKNIQSRITSVSEKRLRGTAEETRQFKELEARLELENKKQDNIDHAADMKSDLDEKKFGLRTYKELTAPTPVFNESIEKVTQKTETKEIKSGLYTEKDFKQLKKIDADLKDFKIGGKPITDEEYMGLVAAVSCSPKYTDVVRTNSTEYDKTLPEAMKPFGITKEQIDKNWAMQHTDWLFGDFMRIKGLRDGEANLFGHLFNPAREESINILRDYQAGKPEAKKALAENITRGCMHIVNSMHGKQNYSDMFMKQCRVMNALAGLMDKDPELKKIAMQDPPAGYGLKEEHIKLVKGMAEVDKADVKAAEAASKLANAALEGAPPMSQEEKKQLVADIVTSRLIQQELIDDYNHIDKDEAHSQLDTKVQELQMDAVLGGRMVQKEDAEKWSADPDSRPMPQPGKLYSDQVLEYKSLKMVDICKPSKTGVNLGEKGIKNYQDLALAIVEKEGLDKLAPEEYAKKFFGRTPEISSSSLVEKGAKILEERKAAAQQAGPAEPQAEKNVQKNEEVKQAGIQP